MKVELELSRCIKATVRWSAESWGRRGDAAASAGTLVGAGAGWRRRGKRRRQTLLSLIKRAALLDTSRFVRSVTSKVSS